MTPNPNGCRHCGADERDHCRIWSPDTGWHNWQAPTDAQRLERMKEGRIARLSSKPLPCLVCGRELESVFASIGQSLMQPGDAVTFHSYGQYGSTSFDPQDNSQVQINVCDDCLLERKNRVWHVRYIRQEAQEIFSRPWDPRYDEQEEVPHDLGD